VPLLAAVGRVIAGNVAAPGPLPASDQAAGRGYALCAADTAAAAPRTPVTLAIVPAGAELRPGTASPIATGAALPAGADAVVLSGRSRVDGEVMHLPLAVPAGTGVLRQGSDVRPTSVVAASGDELTPALAALLADLGVTEVPVYRRPTVCILTCAGSQAGIGLLATLHQAGIPVVATAAIGQSSDRQAAILTAAAQADLVLIVGGDGDGDDRPAADAIAAAGTVVLSGIAVHPPVDVAVGRVAGTPVLALPADPLASLVAADLCLKPLLRRLAGHPASEPVMISARLLESVKRQPDRQGFLPAVVYGGVQPSIRVVGKPERLTTLAYANAYAVIPCGLEILPAGETVSAWLLTTDMFRNADGHLPPDQESLPLDTVKRS
jgi:molybdopterin molybdotransferase